MTVWNQIGASDITDLLANTLGGVIGMGVFFILSKIFKAKVNKVVNIFSLIGAIILVIFICLLLLLNWKTNSSLVTKTQGLINIYLFRLMCGIVKIRNTLSCCRWDAVLQFYDDCGRTYLKACCLRGIGKRRRHFGANGKKWLSILVSSHIIALVQPYHNNALKRVVKMPLLHFLDSGLAAYLLKWGNPEALERGAMSGAFFESYVFSEIYKSYLNAGKEPPVFYYRDKDQKEIDLLLYQNGELSPIEIKKAASPGKTAVKNFNVLGPVTREGTFRRFGFIKSRDRNGKCHLHGQRFAACGQ